MTTGTRREARERALSLLYEAEAKSQGADVLLTEQPVAPDAYVTDLVNGVAARAAEIDGFITTYAKGWAIDRMPAVDRALLRLAIFELLGQPDVPVAVVIDEAVELAKRYSTDDSGRFLNGLLSRIATEVRPS
ncbi:MAG TPA: transcription antitermination factor NusB [Acidimicrobiales bacterium]|nr:transcription antitermination factor NusB [Acidimicrobiales bacterium]